MNDKQEPAARIEPRLDPAFRWYAMARQQQQNIAALGVRLTKFAGRTCLDLLGSARMRRKHHVGERVPEPLSWRHGGVPAPTGR